MFCRILLLVPTFLQPHYSWRFRHCVSPITKPHLYCAFNHKPRMSCALSHSLGQNICLRWKSYYKRNNYAIPSERSLWKTKKIMCNYCNFWDAILVLHVNNWFLWLLICWIKIRCTVHVQQTLHYIFLHWANQPFLISAEMLLIFQTSFQLLAILAKEQFLNWLRYTVCVIHLKKKIQVYVFPLKNSDVTINLFSWQFFPLMLLTLFNCIKICSLSYTHINITDSTPPAYP